MLNAGDSMSALEGLEFQRGAEVISLGELWGSGPLVLIFLRHFG